MATGTFCPQRSQKKHRYNPYDRSAGLTKHILRLPGFSTDVSHIYCVKLPGFECQTVDRPAPNEENIFGSLHSPEQRAALQSLTRDFLGTSLWQRVQQARAYTVVKVGISANPADRLYEIMRGIEGFGAQGTHFSVIRENDSPADTVEKGKLEENIVFIKQCHRKG